MNLGAISCAAGVWTVNMELVSNSDPYSGSAVYKRNAANDCPNGTMSRDSHECLCDLGNGNCVSPCDCSGLPNWPDDITLYSP
jgi:hypothetical protein